MDVDRVIDFVMSRRGRDGGFTFCHPLPSSLPETYYGVYILKTLRAEVDERGVENFLRSKMGNDIYSIYYVYKTLSLLELEVPDKGEVLMNMLERALSREVKADIGGEIGTTATYSFENPNVLREVYMIVESLRILGREVDVEGFVKRFRRDGGYGVFNPNLKDTYYAVMTCGGDGDVVRFVLEHECPEGGFSKKPHAHPPYLEDTYYAISVLHRLGRGYRNRKTADYIKSLQNPDGGFRRSIYLGISTLEDTYYAVASLSMMGEI